MASDINGVSLTCTAVPCRACYQPNHSMCSFGFLFESFLILFFICKNKNKCQKNYLGLITGFLEDTSERNSPWRVSSGGTGRVP